LMIELKLAISHSLVKLLSSSRALVRLRTLELSWTNLRPAASLKNTRISSVWNREQLSLSLTLNVLNTFSLA